MTKLAFRLTSDDHFATSFDMEAEFRWDEGDWRIVSAKCISVLLWVYDQGHEVGATVNAVRVFNDLAAGRDLRLFSVEIDERHVLLGDALDAVAMRDRGAAAEHYGQPWTPRDMYETPCLNAVPVPA